MKSLDLFRRMHDFFPRNNCLTGMEGVILMRLFFLLKENSEATVSDLISLMQTTKPALSQLLNALEEKGYLKRSISNYDRRSVALTITDEGNAVLEGHIKKTNSFLEEVINEFGTENTKKLIDLFNKLSEIVKEIKKER